MQAPEAAISASPSASDLQIPGNQSPAAAAGASTNLPGNSGKALEQPASQAEMQTNEAQKPEMLKLAAESAQASESKIDVPLSELSSSSQIAPAAILEVLEVKETASPGQGIEAARIGISQDIEGPKPLSGDMEAQLAALGVQTIPSPSSEQKSDPTVPAQAVTGRVRRPLSWETPTTGAGQKLPWSLFLHIASAISRIISVFRTDLCILNCLPPCRFCLWSYDSVWNGGSRNAEQLRSPFHCRHRIREDLEGSQRRCQKPSCLLTAAWPFKAAIPFQDFPDWQSACLYHHCCFTQCGESILCDSCHHPTVLLKPPLAFCWNEMLPSKNVKQFWKTSKQTWGSIKGMIYLLSV